MVSNERKKPSSEAETSGSEAQTRPSDRPGRRRLVAMRVLTPVIVVFLLLTVVEVFLQVAMPLPFSDYLYWISDGHIKARLDYPQEVINESGNPVQINALGFRGPNWSWRPPKGTLRLAVFGGSAAFCFQVSGDSHTWPAELERVLNEKSGRPVEVLNLALPGYDTSNSKVNYLFTGRALHPDVVIVYHTWNDLKFLRPLDEARDGETPRVVLSGRPSTGANHSALTRLFRRLQIIRRIDRVRTRIVEEDRENRYTSLEKEGERAHRPIGERAWRWFEKNFDDFVTFVQSDGAMPVLVSQATLARADAIKRTRIRQVIRNDFMGMTSPRLAASYEQATRIIETVAARRNVLYVNGYDAVPPDLTHFNDHVHLIDPGAKRLADVIAQSLLTEPSFQALLASAHK